MRCRDRVRAAWVDEQQLLSFLSLASHLSHLVLGLDICRDRDSHNARDASKTVDPRSSDSRVVK